MSTDAGSPAAADVASGTLDLEELNDPELPVEQVDRRLLALPGEISSS